MLLLLSLACASHELRPVDALDWDLHPELVSGVIRVAPVIVLAEAPQVQLTDGVGEQLAPWLAQGRVQRTAELAELPYAFRDAVPVALRRALPEEWVGRFIDGKLSLAQQIHLAQAVNDQQLSLSQAMSQAARSMDGDATLFTWVIRADGAPLTNSYMVGELVWSEGLPVMVDHHSEPYHVHTELGLALVDCSGQVLFRYQDEYGGVLSAEHDLGDLARELAVAAVGDIAPAWLGTPAQPSQSRVAHN